MTPEQKKFIETLYAQHAQQLYAYAYTIVRDRQIAENLVQETFLDMTRKIEECMAHADPVKWLFTGLRIHLKRYWQVGHPKYYSVPLEDLEEPTGEDTLSYKELLLVAEQVLSGEEYPLFCAYYIDGYSHDAISKKHGISVCASQKRLERIRRKLKTALKQG